MTSTTWKQFTTKRAGPARRPRASLQWGALAALLLAGGTAACSIGEEPGALPRADEAVRVSVSPILGLPASGSHPATVVATRRAEVATRTSGRIRRIAVDVGSRVAAGDVLVSLDDGDVQAGIEGAESAARLARETHARIEALAADGAASDQELDEARSRLESARAELRRARNQAEYTSLVAPFDAVVTERRADAGDLAAPGRPIVTLVGVEGRKVAADLPASLGSEVAEGDTVRVVVPATGREISVPVSRVVPVVSSSARRFRVEMELPPDAGLVPGAFVRVALEDGGETTRWIPADALVHRGQLAAVYTVEDERLRLRWVRPGARRPGAVELLAGPEGPVVREPDPTFYDGQAVEAVEKRGWAGPDAGEVVR